MLAYALTLFASAFLLFLVQPLIGKFVLPWYGGSPAVWTTCMLVFQFLLLGGYAYSHWLGSRLSPRRQALVHGALLLLALVCLPITPSEAWKPIDGSWAGLRVAWLLLVSVGVPFFALSTTGPLLQAWLGVTHAGRQPYRLYALSNLGSLLALVSYPFLVEPLLGRLEQTRLWSLAFVGFVLLCGFCAWRLARTEAGRGESRPHKDASARTEAPVSLRRTLLWLLLPACASALLLATTNVLCEDVAVVPFLWVLPLAVYLLSFILSFSGENGYSRIGYGCGLVCCVLASLWAWHEGAGAALGHQLFVYLATLFVVCMICHGELYRLRPEPVALTRFYLSISLGGCLGGLFVAVVAPLVFSSFVEWPCCLGFAVFLFAGICRDDFAATDEHGWRVFSLLLLLGTLVGALQTVSWFAQSVVPSENTDTLIARLVSVGNSLEELRWWLVSLAATLVFWGIYRRFWRSGRGWHLVGVASLYSVFVVAACFLVRETLNSRRFAVEQTRNFYGVLTVLEYNKEIASDHSLVLRHGRITHGVQLLEADQLDTPTTYYTFRSGVAHILTSINPGAPRKVGFVGLGTGTLAVYGRSGDRFRFYEINPEVVRLARERFSFLARSAAKIEIVDGDARLSMEREKPQGYDVLVLDAFSSDAIPVHLLTREAFAVYLRHLRPGGVLAVHVSNRFLDLAPVVEGLRVHYKLSGATVSHFSLPDKIWDFGSNWVLLSADPRSLSDPAIQSEVLADETPARHVPLWTDDYASVFPLLR